jgi:molybdopterin converting factor small subunit
MSVIIALPTPLQRYAAGQPEVEVTATNVGEALQALTLSTPALGPHLLDKQGKIRSYVNVYLGDEDTRYLQGNDTPVVDGDRLVIVPSIAGGQA